MILGFTGTRDGITEAQSHWLTMVFDELQIDELHHGACVEADHASHVLAAERGIRIIVHPPVKTKFMCQHCVQPGQPNVVVLPAKPYLNRDRDIADVCEGLIATPKNREPQGINLGGIGGTWYTIQWASVRLNKPVMICYPDGEVEKREARMM
jgi:hypothetical protein